MMRTDIRRLWLGCIFLPLLAGGLRAKEDEARSVKTANFEVTAPGKAAQRIADEAEKLRKDLAVLWLGKELPAWGERCPVRVTIRLANTGGATTFTFREGKVQSRSMQLEGALERILDGALPHEMTHVILAEALGKPVPRWADEGAAVCGESTEEGQRHARLFEGVVKNTSRCVPLTRLLGLRDYPPDVAAFYAQGYSVSAFLIERNGRPRFLKLLRTAALFDWDESLEAVYGFKTVGELESAWLASLRPVPQSDTWPRPSRSPKLRLLIETVP